MIPAAVDQGHAKLRFLSSILSVRLDPSPADVAKADAAVQRFVLRDGKVVPAEPGAEPEIRSRTAKISSSPPGSVDSATLDRHRQLVRRQHFLGR